MPHDPINVLFLCTHNSARSILAEGLLNKLGGQRFRGFSAGSRPSGRVNPMALATLDRLGCDTRGMHSKSWDRFTTPDAPRVDFIITVCDAAAGENCPILPGRPATAHWGCADPSAVPGNEDERQAAFAETARLISDRIGQFLRLPIPEASRLPCVSGVQAICSPV
jgi:arsenate reductase